eukprot:357399-Chlamydomonas_euryale.AAC.3
MAEGQGLQEARILQTDSLERVTANGLRVALSPSCRLPAFPSVQSSRASRAVCVAASAPRRRRRSVRSAGGDGSSSLIENPFRALRNQEGRWRQVRRSISCTATTAPPAR